MTLRRAAGWTFDPTIFSPPFFAGSGFVGVKYLKSPVVNGRGSGAHAVQQHDQRRRLRRRRRTPPSSSATSPTTSTRPPATRPATPATRSHQDLLRQQHRARRHAVLPVVRPADPGPGPVRHDRGGLHLCRPGHHRRAAPVPAPATWRRAIPTRLSGLATADNANAGRLGGRLHRVSLDAAPRGNGKRAARSG